MNNTHATRATARDADAAALAASAAAVALVADVPGEIARHTSSTAAAEDSLWIRALTNSFPHSLGSFQI